MSGISLIKKIKPPLFLWWSVIFLSFCIPSYLAAQIEPSFVSEQKKIDQEYQKVLDEGLSCFVEGNYEKAGKLFRHALDLKPDDTTAKKALKSVDLKIKEKDSGRTETEKKEIKKAKQYYKEKQYLLTILTLRPILDKTPDHNEARKILKKVSETMEKIIKKEKEHSYHWLVHKGMESYVNQKFKHAIICWKKAVSQNPGNQITVLVLEQTEHHLKTHPELMGTSGEGEKCDCGSEEEIPVQIEEVKKHYTDEKKTAEFGESKTDPKVSGTTLQIFPVSQIPGFSADLSQEKKEKPVQKFQAVSEPAKTSTVHTILVPKDESVSKTASLNAQSADSKETAPALLLDEQKTETVPDKTEEIKMTKIPQTSELKATGETTDNPAPVYGPMQVDPPEIVEAKSLLFKQNYADSIAILEKYTEQNPWNSKAKEILNLAISEQRELSTRHYHNGLLAYTNGEYSKAIDEWQIVLKIYPNHPTAKKIMLRAIFQNK